MKKNAAPPESLSFRKMSPHERVTTLLEEIGVPLSEGKWFESQHPPVERANQWIENAVGYFSIPLGFADHFVIDGIRRRIPLAVEETSIIAAASAAAKWIQQFGEITTSAQLGENIGQIQFPSVSDARAAQEKIQLRSDDILSFANETVPGLVSRGGGFNRLEVRILERGFPFQTSMLVVHLFCDTKDAMGANLINQACEIVSASIAHLIGEEVGLRIVSNLADECRVTARITLRNIDPALAIRIEEASRFAELDPYRATTHNKGIMNGIDGILIATGNDWRAVEAGAHAYAARSGSYQPLSIWRTDGEGTLEGNLDIPMSLGTVGGVTRTHPSAALCLKLLDVKSARELARIVGAVGLVQNLAALRALCGDGIVAGHMRLHVSNIALGSEASETELPLLKTRLENLFQDQKRISALDARNILSLMRGGR
ncbi:MAG: hydroxymethylglutaryl-CoA reductase, degradative [Cryobacterium sp.]|nr:hydroxymethylglutaryl-CoA reductase, degradative [Oligoflexia bacterium]